jgi:hypothetical protein
MLDLAHRIGRRDRHAARRIDDLSGRRRALIEQEATDLSDGPDAGPQAYYRWR